MKQPKLNYNHAHPQHQEKTDKLIAAIVKAVAALGECSFHDVFSYLWPKRLRKIYQSVDQESLRLKVYDRLHTLGTQGKKIQRTGKLYRVVKRLKPAKKKVGKDDANGQAK